MDQRSNKKINADNRFQTLELHLSTERNSSLCSHWPHTFMGNLVHYSKEGFAF